jgi:bacterioferritin (cytochrome b1)
MTSNQTPKQELINQLQQLLEMDIQAKARYLHDLQLFTDPEITRILQRIEKQEENHIATFNEILSSL